MRQTFWCEFVHVAQSSNSLISISENSWVLSLLHAIEMMLDGETIGSFPSSNFPRICENFGGVIEERERRRFAQSNTTSWWSIYSGKNDSLFLNKGEEFDAPGASYNIMNVFLFCTRLAKSSDRFSHICPNLVLEIEEANQHFNVSDYGNSMETQCLKRLRILQSFLKCMKPSCTVDGLETTEWIVKTILFSTLEELISLSNGIDYQQKATSKRGKSEQTFSQLPQLAFCYSEFSASLFAFISVVATRYPEFNSGEAFSRFRNLCFPEITRGSHSIGVGISHVLDLICNSGHFIKRKRESKNSSHGPILVNLLRRPITRRTHEFLFHVGQLSSSSGNGSFQVILSIISAVGGSVVSQGKDVFSSIYESSSFGGVHWSRDRHGPSIIPSSTDLFELQIDTTVAETFRFSRNEVLEWTVTLFRFSIDFLQSTERINRITGLLWITDCLLSSQLVGHIKVLDLVENSNSTIMIQTVCKIGHASIRLFKLLLGTREHDNCLQIIYRVATRLINFPISSDTVALTCYDWVSSFERSIDANSSKEYMKIFFDFFMDVGELITGPDETVSKADIFNSINTERNNKDGVLLPEISSKWHSFEQLEKIIFTNRPVKPRTNNVYMNDTKIVLDQSNWKPGLSNLCCIKEFKAAVISASR
mmetsp:Transcript_21784/g.33250  ORF Transcript_21784/g.33250 Transcript_21784/m.33250 type:complete len:649 (-) Transcript_21784:250-2196(-)